MAQKGYRHTTRDQRCQIQELMSSCMSLREIGRRVGLHASTVCREIARNSNGYGYNCAVAHEYSGVRRSTASKIPKKMKGKLEELVRQRLEYDWSPEQISGRLKLQGICISHESIYRYVKREGLEHRCLRHAGKKYKKRGKAEAGVRCIPNRVDIAERPAIVDQKLRIGDWEGDTVISHNSRCALITLVDRKSRLSKIRKIGRRTKENTSNAAQKLLRGLPTMTITFDNGGEFADHQTISKKTKAKIYFARPYHSYERGLNEHTNGLIRQYLPKKFDFKDVSDEEIQRIENKLNCRPRKVLGFRTPFEVFFGHELNTTGVALRI
jgi:IS30 family transposase